MHHNRLPTFQDREALVLANRGDGRVVLAPIFFNGKARMALAYLVQSTDGSSYLKILGVCLEPDDAVTDVHGTPAGITPPVEKRSFN